MRKPRSGLMRPRPGTTVLGRAGDARAIQACSHATNAKNAMQMHGTACMLLQPETTRLGGVLDPPCTFTDAPVLLPVAARQARGAIRAQGASAGCAHAMPLFRLPGSMRDRPARRPPLF